MLQDRYKLHKTYYGDLDDENFIFSELVRRKETLELFTRIIGQISEIIENTQVSEETCQISIEVEKYEDDDDDATYKTSVDDEYEFDVPCQIKPLMIDQVTCLKPDYNVEKVDRKVPFGYIFGGSSINIYNTYFKNLGFPDLNDFLPFSPDLDSRFHLILDIQSTPEIEECFSSLKGGYVEYLFKPAINGNIQSPVLKYINQIYLKFIRHLFQPENLEPFREKYNYISNQSLSEIQQRVPKFTNFSLVDVEDIRDSEILPHLEQNIIEVDGNQFTRIPNTNLVIHALAFESDGKLLKIQFTAFYKRNNTIVSDHVMELIMTFNKYINGQPLQIENYDITQLNYLQTESITVPLLDPGTIAFRQADAIQNRTGEAWDQLSGKNFPIDDPEFISFTGKISKNLVRNIYLMDILERLRKSHPSLYADILKVYSRTYNERFIAGSHLLMTYPYHGGAMRTRIVQYINNFIFNPSENSGFHPVFREKIKMSMVRDTIHMLEGKRPTIRETRQRIDDVWSLIEDANFHIGKIHDRF